MIKFNPDYAIFTALAARIPSDPLETVFSYVNPVGLELFGSSLQNKKVLKLISEISDNSVLAESLFKELLAKGSLIIEGNLHDRDVLFHSVIKYEEELLQAAIIDTTETNLSKEGFEYTVGAMARASEANDEDTGHHIIRINHYSAKLAELLGKNADFIKKIGLLAQLHDVGKVHVDPRILKKPGALTPGEFLVMKEHTIYGAKIVGDHPKLALGRQIAFSHHEKWDGSGYPHGLAKEDIPLCARIVAVADVFDALVSKRCYKEGISYEKTLDIFSSKGDSRMDPRRHFDPKILEIFLNHYPEFVLIHSHLKDLTFPT